MTMVAGRIIAPVPRQAPLWSLVDVTSVNTYAAEMPIPNMPSKLNNITFSLRPKEILHILLPVIH